MRIKNTVATLTHGAVSTAVSLARHPISTAAHAFGLAKGTAEAGLGLGLGLVRSRGGEVAEQAADAVASVVPEQRAGKSQSSAADKPAQSRTEDGPREPQVVPKPVPTIDELPEPIVIHADDNPGESFQTEPKAASRDSEHGGAPGDREEATGYVEEIPTAVEDEDEVVWTSESTPGSNA